MNLNGIVYTNSSNDKNFNHRWSRFQHFYYRRVINKGWEVVAVDLKEVPENLKFKAKYLLKDVRDLDKTDLDNVDYIAHLAFITNIPNSIKFPIETTYDNINMSAILLKKAETSR